MITSEQLNALFPAESDLTGEHGRQNPYISATGWSVAN